MKEQIIRLPSRMHLFSLLRKGFLPYFSWFVFFSVSYSWFRSYRKEVWSKIEASLLWILNNNHSLSASPVINKWRRCSPDFFPIPLSFLKETNLGISQFYPLISKRYITFIEIARKSYHYFTFIHHCLHPLRVKCTRNLQVFLFSERYSKYMNKNISVLRYKYRDV